VVTAYWPKEHDIKYLGKMCAVWTRRSAHLPRNVQKIDRGVSGRLPMIQAQEAAQALPVHDRSRPASDVFRPPGARLHA
jgi:hypothetical protein